MSATIGRILLMPKGTYNGSTVYNSLDWVRYNGSAWVCKVDGTVGVVPVEGANWTVLAQDGNVSGNVDWSNINYKPFDDLAVGGGLDVDGSNNLFLDPNYLVGSNIGYENTASGLTASDVQDAIDELAGMTVDLSTDLLAGSNITLTTKPDGKVEISSTGGGGGGSSTLAGLNDVNISSAQNDQVLKYDGSSSKWVNGSAPADYEMINNANAISLLTSKAIDSTDDDVASGYAIANWSNLNGFKVLTQVAEGKDTIGSWNDTWETDGDRTGWIFHTKLLNILSSDDYDITPKAELKAGEQNAIGYIAWRCDDDYYKAMTPSGTENPKALGWYESDGQTPPTYTLTNDTSVQGGKTYYAHGGGVAIKLNAPVPSNLNNVKIGVECILNRTQTFIV